ncbi:MAG: riboflavin synthase [Bacteroidia bacterium]
MFTGIIEALGKVEVLESVGENKRFWIRAPFDDLRLGQSIAHNGVCLSVVEIRPPLYAVEATGYTLSQTNLGDLQAGTLVNLERSLALTSRMEGHWVQGHVDTTLNLLAKVSQKGYDWVEISLPEEFAHLVVEKGSITIDGVSLTVAKVFPDRFGIMLIPHTLENTLWKIRKPNDRLNVEFDILGKYLWRFYRLRSL